MDPFCHYFCVTKVFYPIRISNLFNTIPKTSPLRLTVYQSLLQIAVSKDDLNVLELTKSDVENWLSEWEISAEEKSAFLKSIVDGYTQAELPYDTSTGL